MGVELFESVANSSLHMPLHKSSMSDTSVKCAEGSVFIIPPSKRSQSSIIFSRAQLRRPEVTDLSSDSEPSQFFHYVRSAQHMMRKMGYSLQHRGGLNFEKGRRDFLRNFVPKGKPANYYDKTCRGWDMLHLHLLHRFDLKTTNRSRHALPLPLSGNQMSVWERYLRISLLTWVQVVIWGLQKLLMLNHGLINWIFSGKSDSNRANHLLKTRWSMLTWVVKITLNPSL